MIIFNPNWGGQDVIQDSRPADGMAISFTASIVNDVLGAVPQLDSENSVHSFMQSQFRAAAENMENSGVLYSDSI